MTIVRLRSDGGLIFACRLAASIGDQRRVKQFGVTAEESSVQKVMIGLDKSSIRRQGKPSRFRLATLRVMFSGSKPNNMGSRSGKIHDEE